MSKKENYNQKEEAKKTALLDNNINSNFVILQNKSLLISFDLTYSFS